MEILIDEAGSFALKNAPRNSWCVVAAYSCSETEKRKYKKILARLKRKEGFSFSEEIKLNQISEKNYFQFLDEMNHLNGALFCVATDSSLNHEHLVLKHQSTQVASVTKHLSKMKYKGGRDGLELLASQLGGLPPQLYIQLCCQVQLMHLLVNEGINYFVQRSPNTLQHFRWKIDQKEPFRKIDFEDVFEKFSPVLFKVFR